MSFARRGAMQKQFEAGVANGGEIMLELWISETAAWGVGSALWHGKTNAPARVPSGRKTRARLVRLDVRRRVPG